MPDIKVPIWYRVYMNLTWRQSWHFVWFAWYMWRTHCPLIPAVSCSWSVWWMVIEDCGADPDDLPWKRR